MDTKPDQSLNKSILEELFKLLEKEEKFSPIILEELRKLASSGNLTKAAEIVKKLKS